MAELQPYVCCHEGTRKVSFLTSLIFSSGIRSFEPEHCQIPQPSPIADQILKLQKITVLRLKKRGRVLNKKAIAVGFNKMVAPIKKKQEQCKRQFTLHTNVGSIIIVECMLLAEYIFLASYG